MMLFMHIFEKVLSGEKTQTRRLVKSEHTAAKIAMGTTLEFMPVGYGWGDIVAVRQRGRDIYAIQKDYAVQPARTAKAIARIRITDIRQEDVRNISDEDVIAEGFTDKFEFMRVWVSIHDKELHKQQYWGLESIKARPRERYLAWVLTFELCK